MMLPLSSCSRVNGHVSDCSWVSPIYLDDADVLTPYTAKAILTHNETWEDVCVTKGGK
jgi:hypothetical protein